MKLNFVAIASHELRTPATSIYGIAATLKHQRDKLTPETREELEDTLWEQAVRFRTLIEQLLDLSRLDEKAIRIEPQPLNLRELLADIAADTAPEADVRIDVPAELEVEADRAALERIFGNLVRNAVKYGEPPVVLSVQSTRQVFPREHRGRRRRRADRARAAALRAVRARLRRPGQRPRAVDCAGVRAGAWRRSHL